VFTKYLYPSDILQYPLPTLHWFQFTPKKPLIEVKFVWELKFDLVYWLLWWSLYISYFFWCSFTTISLVLVKSSSWNSYCVSFLYILIYFVKHDRIGFYFMHGIILVVLLVHWKWKVIWRVKIYLELDFGTAFIGLL